MSPSLKLNISLLTEFLPPWLAHNITFVLFKMLFSPQFTRGQKCWRLYWIISGLLDSHWSILEMGLSHWLVRRHVVEGGW